MCPTQQLTILVLLLLSAIISTEAGRNHGRGGGRGRNRQAKTSTTTTTITPDDEEDSAFSSFDKSEGGLRSLSAQSIIDDRSTDEEEEMSKFSKDVLDESDLSEARISLKSSAHTCSPIRMEMCRNIGYNVTSYPNLVGQDVQSDADLQLQTFMPLVQFGCSSRLRFFLCSVYAPMCTEKVPVSIGPCRSLCESVKSRCAPILSELGFIWPVKLNCSRFVAENTIDSMCMEGPPADDEIDDASRPPGLGSYRESQLDRTRLGLGLAPTFSRTSEPNRVDVRVSEPGTGASQPLTPEADPRCGGYRQPHKYRFIAHPRPRCVARCEVNIMFETEAKQATARWSFSCALFLVIVSLVALGFSLFCAGHRTPALVYPERAVLYMCACYAICASAHLYRTALGRIASSCYEDGPSGDNLLVQDGAYNPHCMLTFILLYYFGMAAQAWWLVLACSGAASNVLGWRQLECFSRHRQHWHSIAWIVPGLLTFAIFVMRAVQADELSGMCYVGGQNDAHLLTFVIVPIAVSLVFGLAAMCAGFVFQHCCHAKIKIPSAHPTGHASLGLKAEAEQAFLPRSGAASHSSRATTHKMLTTFKRTASNEPQIDKVLARSRVLAIVMFVLSLTMLVTYVIEYALRDGWLMHTDWQQPRPTSMSPGQRQFASNEIQVVSVADLPSFEVFTIRLIVNMLQGVCCALWLLFSRRPSASCWWLWSKLASQCLLNSLASLAKKTKGKASSASASSPSTISKAASLSSGSCQTLAPHPPMSYPLGFIENNLSQQVLPRAHNPGMPLVSQPSHFYPAQAHHQLGLPPVGYNLTPSDLHFLMNPTSYYPATAGAMPMVMPKSQHHLTSNTLATTTTNSTDVSNTSGSRRADRRHGSETEV